MANTPSIPLRGFDLRGSLLWQSIALLVVALVAVSIGTYAFLNPIAGKTFEGELSKRGKSTIQILGKDRDLRLALSLKDRVRATAVAQEVMAGDTDVQFVMLLDEDGKSIGTARRDVVSDRTLNAALEAAKEGTKDAAKPTADPAAPKAEQAAVGETTVGDTQSFFRTVERDDNNAGGGGLDFDAKPAEAKPLGTIILALSAATARKQVSQLTFEMILITGAVLTLLFMFFFYRLSQRLSRIAASAERMAAGDLTSFADDPGRDEIGRLAGALREMTSRMGGIVGRLQEASGSLTDASSEILASSARQGQSAAHQASSVTETGATLSELKAIFTEAADRAQEVIQLARKSEESTQSGRSAVQESVTAMEQIRDEVTHIARTIEGLVEKTGQIAILIDTVNDLSEQSNVLALNAAIEAARAGEHGKGFAVVAREVRNLAKRSKESTAQVALILSDIQAASREAIAVIEEGTRKAQVGMELAQRAGISIVSLNQVIDASSTAAKQIAASIRQQSAGMEQIWQAMRDIDHSVQEGVTGIQGLERSSQAMKSLSEQMTTLVGNYKVASVAPPSSPGLAARS